MIEQIYKYENNPEVVLVVPFWSQSDAMNWDSNYTFLRRMLPEFIKQRPNWLWVVLFPIQSKGRDGWTYYKDGFFDRPEIIACPWAYDTAMRSSVTAFDPVRFSEIEKTFAPTIYWVHQVEMAMNLYGGYWQTFTSSARPSILAQHHYIIHKSLPYPMDGLKPRLWAQMGGTIAAERVVCNSQHTKVMMEESFSEYLKDDQMGEIMDKTEVLKFGFVNDELFNVKIKPEEKPVILYNHRFEGYKQPHITAETIKTIRDEGYDFEVWVTQTVDQKVGYFPFDRVKGHPDYLKYIENIAVPAINTINSVHETFCISILDSVALGQIVVAPNSVTFPELLPEGYPYLFNNQKEQIQMLRDILDDWDNVYNKWHEPLRQFARENFDMVNYVEKYYNSFDEIRNKWKDTTAKTHVVEGFVKMIKDLPAGQYKLEKLSNHVRKATKLALQAMPNRRVIRIMGKWISKMEWDGRDIIITWDGVGEDL